MANRPNLIGDEFGRLKVIEYHGKRGARRTWLCQCECGGTTIASTSDLRYGGVASCGCLLKGNTSANCKHGHNLRDNGPSLTYNSWRAMVERCSDPNQPCFKRYGGRGITVCDRWKSFENFLKDMGERPSKQHSIDRWPNNNGNYEPDNCRWATAMEQAWHRRSGRP